MKLKEKIFRQFVIWHNDKNGKLNLADEILKLVKEELLSKLPKEKTFIGNRSWSDYVDGYHQALEDIKYVIKGL
jgi:hypothetical protein